MDSATRPTDRSQCRSGARPCPWVTCRYHLLLDLEDHHHSSGEPAIRINSVGLLTYDADSEAIASMIERSIDRLETMPETCALDIADRDGVWLDVVAECLAVSRERARQLEVDALGALRGQIANEHGF